MSTQNPNNKIVTVNTSKNLNLSRDVPMNLEVEQALQGAIISNNLAFEKIENFLRSDFFSTKINKIIFEALKRIISNDQIADINTLKIFLENDEDFKKNGGLDYLLKLCENSLSIVNAKQYGELIYDLFVRRKLINVGTELINDCYNINNEDKALKIIEQTEKELFELSNNDDISRGPRTFEDILINTMDYAEKAFKKSEEVIGLRTGLTDFDKKIGGLHKSDLIIVAGRPSMGKTAFATNLAYNITKDLKDKKKEKNVIFFSLEMSSEQLATRIVSEIAGLSSENIRTGNLSKNDFNKLITGSESLKDLNLFIDDTPALTISSIRTRARRMKRKHGLDLIILDYLQLVSSDNRYNDSRVQEISEITRGLKAIAKELDIPVIALSQLSRKVEDREEKRPQLADLRESGSIEQDADLVVFLYREEYYLARTEPSEGTDKHEVWTSKMEKVHNVAEAIIAKNRHGPISKVRLHFNPSITKFSDLAETSF